MFQLHYHHRFALQQQYQGESVAPTSSFRGLVEDDGDILGLKPVGVAEGEEGLRGPTFFDEEVVQDDVLGLDGGGVVGGGFRGSEDGEVQVRGDGRGLLREVLVGGVRLGVAGVRRGGGLEPGDALEIVGDVVLARRRGEGREKIVVS